MATYPITFTSSIALCDATFTYSAEVFDVTTNTWAATGTHDFISSFVTSTGTITVQTSDFAQYYDNPSKYYIIKI